MKNHKKIFWSKPSIQKEEISAINKVAKSTWLTQGNVTEQLEKNLCKKFNVKNAVVTNSGTSSLICALLAHGIKPGDEVLVPSFTFISTVNSILSVGAKPVLVDSDPSTFNTETKFLKQKISKKTRAIMPVDVSGMPLDISEMTEFANKNNLILIEDAAEAIGAKYKNKKIGSFGHSTIFSFHMAKVVSGIEGGCILTDNSQIASKLRSIRSHGDVSQYNSKFFGLNFRISDIHSAVITEQLKKLDMFLEHRQNLAKLYKDELSNLVEFQSIPSFVTLHPFMLFAILVKPQIRNKLNKFLNQKNIETRICWPPVHKQKYHSTIFPKTKLIGSEEIFSKIINLPMGNGLTEEEALHIVKIIKKWYKLI
jgi:perosamine synthetase